jgi:NAD(P)-dependent dehydrogenase (short-subunit alcohol dehydrogenase family)
VDLKPIKVNCVAPGAVNTELIQPSSGDRLDAVLKHFRDMTTTGMVGRLDIFVLYGGSVCDGVGAAFEWRASVDLRASMIRHWW